MPPGSQTFSLTHPEYAASQHVVDVTPGEQSVELRLDPAERVSLGGVLRHRNGIPLPGVSLELRGLEGHRVTRQAEDSGRFWFEDLTPGPYTLTVVGPWVLEPSQTAIELTEPLDGLELIAAPPCRLVGTLPMTSDAEWNATRFVVRSGSVVWQVAIDRSTNRFQTPGLFPGAWVLEVQLPGLPLVTQSLQCDQPGGTVEVDLAGFQLSTQPDTSP